MQGSVGKTGVAKPKLVLKTRTNVDERNPMPLKYRCQRAAEEFKQRVDAKEEAKRRRLEVRSGPTRARLSIQSPASAQL
jgi:hypothetical protein